MSVEQTSQLIQLILNSALMIVVSVLVLGALWLRHNAIADQLKVLQRQFTRTQQMDLGLGVDALASLKQQRFQLQARYRLTRHSTLVMHYALLAFVTSLFTLAIRTVLNVDGLIPTALVLFVLGSAGLLTSVVITLMDFYQLGSGGMVPIRTPSDSMSTLLPPLEMRPRRSGDRRSAIAPPDLKTGST